MTTFADAVSRWASIGPYYAMFPIDFAFQVVEEHSRPGDALLDPFAGRFSSVYAAAALDRSAVGIEINPVGWLYGSVKLRPASRARVISRLQEIGSLAERDRSMRDAIWSLPPFFRAAYAPRVLQFLMTARRHLAWRSRNVDATLMTFILIYLHGKREAALSNQMRDGKAMAPDYSVRWWAARELTPPDVDPVAFLTQRIDWRYRKGKPSLDAGVTHLGDSIRVLRTLHACVATGKQRRFNLLFTSPPYRGVTNYHQDQWLRLWMLGGPSNARRLAGHWQQRFDAREKYVALLSGVFCRSAALMARKATVYVRTDARQFTFDATLRALQTAFPRKGIDVIERPLTKRSQTALFGDKTQKPGEVDLVLTS